MANLTTRRALFAALPAATVALPAFALTADAQWRELDKELRAVNALGNELDRRSGTSEAEWERWQYLDTEILKKIEATPARSVYALQVKASAVAICFGCAATGADVELSNERVTCVRIAEDIVRELLAMRAN